MRMNNVFHDVVYLQEVGSWIYNYGPNVPAGSDIIPRELTKQYRSMPSVCRAWPFVRYAGTEDLRSFVGIEMPIF
jgi:hypothetical protein